MKKLQKACDPAAHGCECVVQSWRVLRNDESKSGKCATTPDQQFKWNRCIVTVDKVVLRAFSFESALRPPTVNPFE